MTKSNAEIAVELQSKFELYFLGLIFTILGLSIQTAKFGQSSFADTFELLGWTLLLASALSGILRGEWAPVLYQIFDKQKSTETRIDRLEAAGNMHPPVTFVNDDGSEEQVNAAAAITRLEGVLRELQRQLNAIEEKNRRRYQVMKWGFFGGIVLLVAARAYLPSRLLSFQLAIWWAELSN